MKPLILLIGFMMTARTLFAQDSILRSGKIEYIKSVNTYAIAREIALPGNTYERYKDNHPQFATTLSTLLFKDGVSLFTPLSSQKELRDPYNDIPLTDQPNIIYSNFNTKRCITQKNVLDENVLIKDSLRQIKWKITDEFQEIAGYNCRRANALIMDSVYVVAFYTDEIHFNGGPESFCGLPGMIMEVALPHEHVTWKASKVVVFPIEQTIQIPGEGTPLSREQVLKMISTGLKSMSPKRSALINKGLLL